MFHSVWFIAIKHCRIPGSSHRVSDNKDKFNKGHIKMADAEYKLIHFNTRFLAEPIRYIFAYARVPYEDVRIPVDDWKTLKENNNYTQLPILELKDGRHISQSSAISEFLAKRFNLLGESEFDAARCTEISDAMRDVRQEWRKYYLIRNRDRQIEQKRHFVSEIIPKYFGQLSKMQAESGGDYLICDMVTWVDLLVTHTIAFIQETVDPTCFDAYPNLIALKDKIYETPQLKKWMTERPKPDLRMLTLVPISV